MTFFMTNYQENLTFFNRWAYFYNYDPISIWLLNSQKKILNKIPLNNKYKILDVGCGTGNSLNFLYRKGFRSLYGVDLSPNMINKAKLNNKNKLFIASVEKLPFKSNFFDIVICTEAFHHFPNPKKSITEMFRVLKKGGLLYLADINFHFKLLNYIAKLEPGHVKIYDKTEFKNFFRQIGLKIIKQKAIGLFIILTIGKK